MLIRNNKGDWGLVTAKWGGKRKPILLRKARKGQRGRKGRPGSYGNLSVNFLKFDTQKKVAGTYSTDSTSYGNLGNFNLGDLHCRCDGIELCRNHHEAAEYAALAFSISILHLWCQPRSTKWYSGCPPNYYFLRKEDPLQATLPPDERVPFLRAAGALTYVPCNKYIKKSHDEKKKGKLKKKAPIATFIENQDDDLPSVLLMDKDDASVGSGPNDNDDDCDLDDDDFMDEFGGASDGGDGSRDDGGSEDGGGCGAGCASCGGGCGGGSD